MKQMMLFASKPEVELVAAVKPVPAVNIEPVVVVAPKVGGWWESNIKIFLVDGIPSVQIGHNKYRPTYLVNGWSWTGLGRPPLKFAEWAAEKGLPTIYPRTPEFMAAMLADTCAALGVPVPRGKA